MSVTSQLRKMAGETNDLSTPPFGAVHSAQCSWSDNTPLTPDVLHTHTSYQVTHSPCCGIIPSPLAYIYIYIYIVHNTVWVLKDLPSCFRMKLPMYVVVVPSTPECTFYCNMCSPCLLCCWFTDTSNLNLIVESLNIEL